MSVFDYKALNKSGKEIKGVLEGDSARVIRQKLKAQGLIPIEVMLSGAKSTIDKANKDESSSVFSKIFHYKKVTKLSVAEVALLTRQLATLLSAGMQIEESLKVVSEQSDNPKITRVILAVRAKVLEGQSLATGLSEHKGVFSDLYCATVNAGEHSGHLDLVLESLADYTEKQYKLSQKIRQASVYPIIMICLSFAIVGFLVSFVVPKLVSTFQQTGHDLPTVTVILIYVSDFLKSYGVYLIILLFAGIYLFKIGLKNNKFAYKWHKFLLKIPMIGNAIKVINTSRFSRTFGILSKSGVSVLEAMKTASAVVLNKPIQEALVEVIKKVREGGAISKSLQTTKVFPPMSIHLIASGESSGKLEMMLERSADYQDQEIENLIGNFISLFEPVLFIVLAVLLPIFQMQQFVGN